MAAVREALADGTIDAVATDHAPHSSVEKDVEFEQAASGMIGLETALGPCLELVHGNLMTPMALFARMSTAPAKILGLPGGTLRARLGGGRDGGGSAGRHGCAIPAASARARAIRRLAGAPCAAGLCSPSLPETSHSQRRSSLADDAQNTSPAPALLALEDGSVYRGTAFGAAADQAGELVFNTAITGYQEILTDPSYRGQIVMMTAPEIGNVGVNLEDYESVHPFCAGFVVRNLARACRAGAPKETCAEFMAKHGVAGIAGIDTRAITRRLRIGGAQRALITRNVADPAAAVERARKHPSLEGRDLVKEVTSAKPYAWNEGMWQTPGSRKNESPVRHRVVAYDFGIKRGILRRLRRPRVAALPVVPAQTSAKDVLAQKPDGIFLSNGPGDPAAVDLCRRGHGRALRSGRPMFGICLGHQILGLALGGKTYKLKFGHHGANHPVMDLTTRKVEITSQNHGFAVDVDSLAGKAVLTHVNLNDNTVEGMRHDRLPIFSVQYHPEASPGPNDPSYLFDRFVKADGRSSAVTTTEPSARRWDPGLIHTLLDELASELRRARPSGGHHGSARGLLHPLGQGLRG